MALAPSVRHVLFGAVAAVVVLAGCSSDDGTSTSTSTTAAADGSADPRTRPPRPVPPDAPDSEESGPLERYADYETVSYDDPAHWVCRPDITDDICDGDLDATVIEADGTLTPKPFERAEDPTFDCFYVYPTNLARCLGVRRLGLLRR